ncbi:hypothetical protein [Propionispora hippei]|uniref:hypothetical protein n=1 Tax=Propionispora hippei TaxID=209080 RepID=UPI00165FFB56|nr:hypothetical protein [Propionispora hippei]
MSKAWGIYIRYGKICMTKRVGCLLQATQRYNRLMRWKKKPDLWIALVPIHDH